MIVAQLTADNAIDGDQLVAQIEAALGIDVGHCYGFVAPRTVWVGGHDDQAPGIQAAIAAHVPAAPAPTPAQLQRQADLAALKQFAAANPALPVWQALARLLGTT